MESVKKDLSQKLKEVREYLGLSQQYVSEQTDISRVAISQIECGKRKIDSKELEKLAAVYKYPISYFLGDSEKDDQSQLFILTRATKGLSDEDLDQVIKYAEFLKGLGKRQKNAE